MRLLSCHIENFGKLHDFSYDFAPGLNVFAHENGWGKTTLAAFLRVMLYGFEGENRRDASDNERLRFSPWQGGPYGGTLLFEVNGDHYRLHRTFGEKRKNDTFALYDDRTGFASDRFRHPVGEALFGIDAESFRNSVCMIRNDLPTRATVGIQAKIGDLAEDNTDLKSYDQAAKRLKKEADKLSPHRSSGLLSKLAQKDSELAARASQEEAMRALVHSAQVRLDHDRQTNAALQQKQEQLQRQTDALLAERDRLHDAAFLRNLIAKETEDRQKVKELRAHFPADVPESKEIRACLSAALSSAESDSMLRRLDDAAQLRRSISQNRSKGREEQAFLRSTREEHALHDEKIFQTRTKIRYGLYFFSILSVFVTTFLLITLFADRPTFSGILLLILFTALTAALMAVSMRYKSKPPVDLMSLQYEQQELELKRSIRNLSHEIHLQEERALELERQIKQFLTGNGFEPDLQTAYSRLLQIRAKARGPQAVDIPSPEEFLASFEIEAGETPIDTLMEVRDLRAELGKAAKELRNSVAARKRFMKEHPALKGTSKTAVSPEDHAQKLRLLSDSMTALGKDLLSVRRQIDSDKMKLEEAQSELMDCLDAAEERLLLQKRIEEVRHRYFLLGKTAHYLQKARAEFTARYRNPFLRSLKRYYGMMTESSGEQLMTDASFDVQVVEGGAPREISAYSTGHQDLLSICRRMAMVDAMYPSEKPFLILDDPFVNLDEAKTDGGLLFLQSVSADYQILYFTCHKSRVP